MQNYRAFVSKYESAFLIIKFPNMKFHYESISKSFLHSDTIITNEMRLSTISQLRIEIEVENCFMIAYNQQLPAQIVDRIKISRSWIVLILHASTTKIAFQCKTKTDYKKVEPGHSSKLPSYKRFFLFKKLNPNQPCNFFRGTIFLIKINKYRKLKLTFSCHVHIINSTFTFNTFLVQEKCLFICI